MSLKKHLLINLALLLLFLLSLMFFDQKVVSYLEKDPLELRSFFYEITLFMDGIFNLIDVALFSLAAAATFAFFTKTKALSLVIVTSLATCIICSGLTNLIKAEVKRPRPSTSLLEQSAPGKETSNDYSFPSSHTSFYMGIFLPFLFLPKRIFTLIFIIPLTISLGRIVQNEHYVSDVLFSVLLVLNVASCIFYGLSRIYGEGKPEKAG